MALRKLTGTFSAQATKLNRYNNRVLTKHPARQQALLFNVNKKAYSTEVLTFGGSNRKLFTPGPLMVTDRVKSVMLADLGVRHSDFAYIVHYVRTYLLQLACVSEEEFTTVPVNGSGAFVTEATLKTMLGGGSKKLIVMSNGKYGDRVVDICKSAGINYVLIPFKTKSLEEALRSNQNISAVFAVHCETSSGWINPVENVAAMVKKHSKDIMFMVDAMTSFGAIPIDMKNVDFLLSNSCKSLQGVPGISFVIARKSMLEKHRYRGNGMVLDIGAQYDELEKSGEFRFTPPVHVMLAFREALMEHAEEGGMEGRAERYKENSLTLKQEMAELGFQPLYSDNENPEGYFLTSFMYPRHPLFVFNEFYNRLADKGYIICSARQSVKNCFRIGCMGDVSVDDMKDLVFNIRHICSDMRLTTPLIDPTF